ncbi:MAG: hypothetical protein FWH27_06790 [Planctomycetaceae bacterium]|nr:hypothetical protein [Planctomycetaceae bacterium]
MSPFFSRIFGTSENIRGSQNPRHKSRKLHYEPLEERQLLAVTTAEFDQIRGLYPDLNLSENMGDYNVIEIEADDLSVVSLRNAINEAGATTENDLIVVRTTETLNTITLDGTELAININAEEFGSVTIVSLGEERLTIDGNQESRVVSITDSAVRMAGLTITGGYITDQSGGGIENDGGTLTLINCTISGNTAESGGGISNSWDGLLTVSNSVVSDNTAENIGGGISNGGELTVTNSTIIGNSAESSYYDDFEGESYSYGFGGGIFSYGELTVNRCTISDNTAGVSGGGIENETGTATIVNSEITGNSAVEAAGISNAEEAEMTVINSTISGNNGGGIQNYGAMGMYWDYSSILTLYNTIVAENSDYDILNNNPIVVEGNNNLTTFTDWGNPDNNNLVYNSALPLFVDAKNGDYRLSEGSQAINKGDNTHVLEWLTTDLDGNDRIVGGIVDIGAYEFFEEIVIEPESPSLIVTTLEDIVDEYDGFISLREAIAYANAGDTITFAEELEGQTIVLNGNELLIDKNITIDATEAGIIIDADQKSRVINIAEDAEVVLAGLVITNGYADNGGGVLNSGVLTVINSTISGNTADHCGGGIYSVGNTAELFLTGNVISGNTADKYGGGIFIGTLSAATLTNATIAGNTANDGSGIFNIGIASLDNSIVAENPESDITNFGLIEGTHNLTTVDDWDDNFVYNPELPLFVDVENGDYRLIRGSQAIDQGNGDNVTAEFDLDGNPRIMGNAIDIGAYEYQTLPAELVVSEVTMAESAIAGTGIDVSWVMANIGDLAASESREVNIYFSADDLMEDILIGTFEYTTVIDAETSITQTEQVAIPLDAIGTYQIVVVVSGENTSIASSVRTIDIAAPTLAMYVDKDSLREGVKDGVLFTITRNGNLSEALELAITSSDTAELTVPEIVIIPTGESIVTFYGSSIQDFVKDGDKQVTVTVAAEGFDAVTTVITVLDIPPAELVVKSLVVIPEQVIAGTPIDVSWIISNIGELPFEDDLGEIFYITNTGYPDDNDVLADFTQIRLIEGGSQLERTETITIPLGDSGEYQIILECAGQYLVSDIIAVTAPELGLTSDVTEIREGVEDGIAFTVTRTGNLDEALELIVTSCNTAALAVPETVIVPAGESFVTFYGSSIQDFVKDGDKPVTVTVAAEYYVAATIEVIVLKVAPVEPVNTWLTVPETARPGSTVVVSWNVTNDGYMISTPVKWIDNIYLSPDGQLENAVLVGSFPGDFELEPGGFRLRMESITLPAGVTGDYCLILQTVYGGNVSEPVLADILLSNENYTPQLVMPDLENVHWTIQRNADKLRVVNELGQTIFEDDPAYLDGMEITVSTLYDSGLTVDLSQGDWVMTESLVFTGNPEQQNTLTLIGSDDDDVFHFESRQGTANGLQLAWSDVGSIFVDGRSGYDTVTLINDEGDAIFAASDNLFTMNGGGQRIEIVNINIIDAFGLGKHDAAYIYGENDSLMIMNDTFTERHGQDQVYRIWYAEQVTSVNRDDTNNTVLHTGSRSYDVYTLSEGYGTATNATGSYSHELIGFVNNYIFTPVTTPTVSLPEEAEWVQEDDRIIWSQNDFTVTVLGNATIVTRGDTELPGDTEEPGDTTPDTKHKKSYHSRNSDCDDSRHKHWDESLCAFLAEEHLRSHRKKDKCFGQDDEGDDWQAEFEELTLLDLMK